MIVYLYYFFSRKDVYSVYREVGERCDRLGVFKELGHFLLRGHTLFTMLLLSVSLVIFIVTVYCHRRVQKQHHFLNGNATTATANGEGAEAAGEGGRGGRAEGAGRGSTGSGGGGYQRRRR